VFWGAAAGLFGVAVAGANLTMQLTNPDLEQEHMKDTSDQLSKLPMDVQVRWLGSAWMCCSLGAGSGPLAFCHPAAAAAWVWCALAAQNHLPPHTHQPKVAARRNREHLKAMIKDVASGKDGARYKSTLE